MYRLQVTGVIVLLTLTGAAIIKRQILHPDAGLNIYELAQKYEYPIESHQVQTEDGYILTLHRIPHGTGGNSEIGPPVLLMHGLLSSSADWVNMGPGKALALLLADNGYDVWLGNQRGNTWSRKHIKIDPDQNPEKFFDFSFHEIGVYDLPAKIDYILNNTGESGVFYVGHSQGTTDFFVMAAEKPEYNDKIRLMTALAPIVYTGNLPNPFISQVIDHLDLIDLVVEIFQIYEFLPHYQYFTELGKKLCSDSSEYQVLCVWILNAIAGFDWEIDPNFVPVITSSAPAGASIKQLQHYFQETKSGEFRQYDYGFFGNIIKYGQSAPPSYDIAKITAPVSLYYSSNDWLDAIEDVQKLAEQLPNLINAKKIFLEQFNHLDFLWAQDIVDLLNNDVIMEIKSIN